MNVPKECQGCGQPLLMANLFVDDGCPCNTPRGVNMTPLPCALCKTDNCVKPGHRLGKLFGYLAVPLVNGEPYCLDCGGRPHDHSPGCTKGDLAILIPTNQEPCVCGHDRTEHHPCGSCEHDCSCLNYRPATALAWLKVHAKHAPSCAKMSRYAGTPEPASFMDCTCGLDALIGERTQPAGRGDSSGAGYDLSRQSHDITGRKIR